jgi:hypothetical protein
MSTPACSGGQAFRWFVWYRQQSRQVSSKLFPSKQRRIRDEGNMRGCCFPTGDRSWNDFGSRPTTADGDSRCH